MNTPTTFVILLAEDESADAHLVKVAISENRILADLHIVADGREALEFLRCQGTHYANAPRPDLILLDLNMPRMDGREFFSVIKQDATLKDIPVVVLTTSDVERDIVASYHLGAAGYVTKPWTSINSWKRSDNLASIGLRLVRLPRQI